VYSNQFVEAKHCGLLHIKTVQKLGAPVSRTAFAIFLLMCGNWYYSWFMLCIYLSFWLFGMALHT